MNIKRVIKEKLDDLFNKVDSKLLEYIDRFIKEDMTDIEKALVIYLCLGDVLYYSPLFSLSYDYDRVSLTSDVSLENNEIICKNWAILYHRILTKYNIISKVVKKKGHYKTEIINDGTYYSVDGTGYGAYGMHYSMSDIARIKFGFKIEKFFVSGTVDPYDLNLFMTKNRELEESIDKVYKIQGRKIISNERINAFIKRAMQIVELNSNKVGFGTKEDIDYRIKIINRFWRLNITSSPLEKMQLFNSFYKVVFSDYEEYESKCYNVYSWLDDKISMYKLFVIDINDGYYYYLDDGREFREYSKKDLLKEFEERNIRISDYTEILGIYSGLENFKLKK